MMEGGFWIGMHHLRLCKYFPTSFINVNRFYGRSLGFECPAWVMDSGAFSELLRFGSYTKTVREYADIIRRWQKSGSLKAAVTQDYMCEDLILKKTGLEVKDHQELTVGRYDELMVEGLRTYVMPVLQGYEPGEYVRHLKMYGRRLAKDGMWVGVGSVCKRNSTPDSVREVLAVIKSERPDLRLHGFGLKTTALMNTDVLSMLWSSDSTAWSLNARLNGRNANGLEEAREFWDRVQGVIKNGQATLDEEGRMEGGNYAPGEDDVRGDRPGGG